uniref:Cytochrome c oxidase assembly protein COX20, mitochondrial n=1 Tax=Schizaphis graminum TaxID=13262 RepID=A0A2S2PPU0_SCHGA
MASISSDEDHKPLMFLGKDVSRIPCFRNSFLYGIVGGFTMGIGYFLCTSRTLRSTHFGFGSFVTISSVYWCLCRYNYDNTEEKLNELKGIIKAKKSGADIKD